ncbi:hypothetical protein C8F01DRAFT_1188647 [Mycena amicta]|nr:hypothetical protein C8F01DRAFT_1188647 [Mycena amicta]
MFRTLLCGCIRSEDDIDVIPDERTRLLDDLNARGRAEHKTRETLEAIVRSASSKMVNVYSRKPFRFTSIGNSSNPSTPAPSPSQQRCPKCSSRSQTHFHLPSTSTPALETPPIPTTPPTTGTGSRRNPTWAPILTMRTRGAAQALRWDNHNHNHSRQSSPAVSRSSSLRRRPGSPLRTGTHVQVSPRSDLEFASEPDSQAEGYFTHLPPQRADSELTAVSSCVCQKVIGEDGPLNVTGSSLRTTRKDSDAGALSVNVISLVYSWEESRV